MLSILYTSYFDEILSVYIVVYETCKTRGEFVYQNPRCNKINFESSSNFSMLVPSVLNFQYDKDVHWI